MKIYISGKISGLSSEIVYNNFGTASMKIKKIYNSETLNPLYVKPFLGIKHWLFYMINDLRAQRKCTHSAFQYNWMDSKGAVIEYFFAKFIYKQKIIFLTNRNLES